MKRLIALLTAAGLVLATLPGLHAARGQDLVCFRDGTCVPVGSTATPATPDGTRPPTFTQTPVATPPSNEGVCRGGRAPCPTVAP